MTLIAENELTLTRKLFDEAFSAIQNKDYKKTVMRLTLLLALLFGAVALWLVHTGGSLLFLLGEAIFLTALLFWLLFLLPRTRARSLYRALCPDPSRPPRRTTRFYADHFEVTDQSGKRTSFACTDVTGLRESAGLWLLDLKDRQCVMLAKDGFTAGDMEQVQRLLPL